MTRRISHNSGDIGISYTVVVVYAFRDDVAAQNYLLHKHENVISSLFWRSLPGVITLVLAQR